LRKLQPKKKDSKKGKLILRYERYKGGEQGEKGKKSLREEKRKLGERGEDIGSQKKKIRGADLSKSSRKNGISCTNPERRETKKRSTRTQLAKTPGWQTRR